MRSSKACVPEASVCILDERPLAVLYLRSIFRRCRVLRIVSASELSQLDSARPHALVFLIDEQAMEVPLRKCLSRLKDLYPSAKFVVLGWQRSKGETLELLRLADGFVSYGDAEHQLCFAVRADLQGKVWWGNQGDKTTTKSALALTREKPMGGLAITCREKEILDLLKHRLSNKEIAQILDIELSTVKYHVSNILSKLGAANRWELTKPQGGGLWDELHRIT